AEIIERRWQARSIKSEDGITYTSPLVFHRGVKKSGQVIPVQDFDKAFRTACEAVGIEYGRKTGHTAHCFRRTGIRSMRKGGVPESVIMSISGHQTASVFKRYDITDSEDTGYAILAVDAKRKAQAPEPSNVLKFKLAASK